MIMVYILGGIILTNTAVALYFVPSTKDISRKYLRHFFRIIPSFCLGDAIFYISILELVPGTSKWDLLFSGYDILYMSCEAVVYFALAIAIDKLQSIPSFVGLFKKDPEMPPPQGEVEPEDDDCRAERERLQQTSIMGQGGRKYTTLTDALEQHGVEDALNSIDKSDPRNDLIRIEGLRKVYPKKTAVKDVYFGVPAGQCFGFLGVNGAGRLQNGFEAGGCVCHHIFLTHSVLCPLLLQVKPQRSRSSRAMSLRAKARPSSVATTSRCIRRRCEG
jgi:ATP-binding cassette subfamily A (ABC1) protein 3